MLTRSGPKAQGKGIKSPVLTGNLSWNGWPSASPIRGHGLIGISPLHPKLRSLHTELHGM
jgi:hypothetical protein